MDAQTLRRVLADFFKFNPADFQVQASPTGFHVSFLRKGGAGGSSTGAGGSAPVVTSISPATGARGGGTTVVITGGGFTDAIMVMFGGVAANFTVDSPTQITATSPSYTFYANLTVAVRVFTSSGANPSGTDFTYSTT